MDTTTPTFAVHYGHHEGTTGSHLAEAVVRLGIGTPHPASHGQHLLADDLGAANYLWIESGVVSFPIDTCRADALTAGYLIDVHLHIHLSRLQAQLFDVVFVAQRDLVPEIRKVHPQVHWLPLAAPARLTRIPRGDDYDASFVGHLLPWTSRARIMKAVSGVVRTNDYERKHSLDEMGTTYAHSRIVVNPAVANDLNMRFFEGLACGAAIVTPDVGNGQDEIAVRGRDFFVCDFSSPDEVAREVAHLVRLKVSGSEGRRVIAAAHTYDHRVRTVVNVMGSAAVIAPIRSMSRRERSTLFSELAIAYYDGPLARHAMKHVRWPRDLSRHTAMTYVQVGVWKDIKRLLRQRLPRLVGILRRHHPASLPGSDRRLRSLRHK